MQYPLTMERAVTDPKRRHRWLWPLAAVLVVAVGAGVFILSRPDAPSVPQPTPTTVAVSTFTMTGAFDVFVNPTTTDLATGAACRGSGASADIADGTTVSVFDHGGKMIAGGSLGGGTYQSTPIGSACVFALTVDDVPDGLLTYSVEVGQRGVKSLSPQQAHGHVFMSDGP